MTSCPYCNAAVAVSEPAPRRVTCSRCGESFAYKGTAESPAGTMSGESHVTAPIPESPSLRRPAGIGLALGLIVLAVGLSVQFWPSGGSTDASLTPKAPSQTTLPPTAVPALRYLPPESEIVFAFQPGPLISHAERTDQKPETILEGLGLPGRFLLTFQQVGLPLADINQLVGSLILPADNVFPRIVVALRLNAPLPNNSPLLEKLKAERYRTTAGENRFRVSLQGYPFRMSQPEPATLLFVTEEKDLDFFALQPSAEHLSADVRESMALISPASLAWIVTGAADWNAKPTVQAAITILKRPELGEKLKRVRAAGVGLSLEPELLVTAAMQAPTAKEGTQLRDSIAAALVGEPWLIGGHASWVTIEGSPDAATRLVAPRNP